MYRLTKDVIKILGADKNLQLQVAILMGNGYMAVHMDLQKPKYGRTIAQNHDALEHLSKHLKLPISQIRKKQSV